MSCSFPFRPCDTERSSPNPTPLQRLNRTTPGQVVRSLRSPWLLFAMLVAALVLIALLGREVGGTVDRAINKAGLPTAVGGMIVALLTLTSESISRFSVLPLPTVCSTR